MPEIFLETFSLQLLSPLDQWHDQDDISWQDYMGDILIKYTVSHISRCQLITYPRNAP